jgi:hypothetical protein
MPTNQASAVTISIVSHGQLALVLPLLAQLDRYCTHCIEKVVLTSNVAEPDLLAGQLFGFPIERIANARPLGFGANHNQAFQRCRSAWFLVLNPDIRLDGDIIAPLMAQAHEDSGLLTPRIVEPNADGAMEVPEPHRAMVTPLEILTRRRAGYASPASPEWIPGLFMLFRTRAFAQIEGFDARRFFMYGEDVDICARLQLAGWKIQVDADSMAVHEARRASHRSMQHLYWHVSSLLKVWLSPTFWRYLRLQRQLGRLRSPEDEA